ncbi:MULTISPECIES: hypothetical protein [Kocuria]|uniref:hypothetical protein n=1 Tax=Kocuria TaxID=57493 RepID=UPI0013A68884|nr:MULTISPECIES: hypothetical protein [Kocuria]MCC5671415.1 hypothetical protein [Kocuria rhizophila]MCC5673348.1 hypothetical protein [Kocuria rhizophila]
MENPRQLLQPHLRPDEELLWAGRPDPRVHFMPFDVFLVPFSIFWCAFAVYWTWLVLTSAKSPRWFALVGLLFVAVGLYQMVGRFLVKARRKRRTVYGLTDTRAIVVEDDRRISEVRVKDVAVKIRKSRDGGRIEVISGEGGLPGIYLNSGVEFFSPTSLAPMAFFDVPNPEGLLPVLERVR